MTDVVIQKGSTADARFPLKGGAGSDAVHTDPVYAYAICHLHSSRPGLKGTGLAFTLGAGNELVCQAIRYLFRYVEGREIRELMAEFGKVFKTMAEDPKLRWLGPHKGVVHLALASVVNACFDLWAKAEHKPLWKLLIDLSPEAIFNTLDLSYLEDVLNHQQALALLREAGKDREQRLSLAERGYPGYDTSVGWFQYSDEQVKENIRKAMAAGFTAMKLKVGSEQPERDIRRAYLLREIAGEEASLMLDANQQWNLPRALQMSEQLRDMRPYWIEEPTHPDDVQAHLHLADAIRPFKLAMGEHLPNRIVFKNYLQVGVMAFNQVDALRVGGVSEFITISLLSKKFGVPVVPHVGDMGQLHQHLVLFNHIALGHQALFLEYIPHLRSKFKFPAEVKDGTYRTPQVPGSSTDLTGF